MAKKKSFLGTLVKLGGLAAATAVVYSKRNEIKAFLADAAERMFPEDAETEPDVVIDATETAGETENTQEDAPAQ